MAGSLESVDQVRPYPARRKESSIPEGLEQVIPRFMNERSGLSLMFAVLVDASAGWRGVTMTPAVSQELEALRTSSKGQATNSLAA
jgi:hypothetical protein